METRQQTYVKCLIASVKINVMGAYADGKWISEEYYLLQKNNPSWYKQTSKTRITDSGSRSFNWSEWQQTFHKQ